MWECVYGMSRDDVEGIYVDGGDELIIREGFVRDVGGRWLNLKHVVRFGVEVLVNHKYGIVAITELKDRIVYITAPFDYEDDAIDALDAGFGYLHG
jgi:hypothetical protein